jgi:maltooligosyltrehalose trehalohydrolase
VNLFAPCPVYGSPDDLRRLVDDAHRLGLSVILDVVYNHLGPDGNYLSQFSKSYFTDKYPAEWGEPIRFEGEEARPVRDFFVQNAVYWISEFHFDGLRLDATQSLFDSSKPHIIAELAEAAREATPDRRLLIIGETEPQDVTLVRPREQGGHGLDAIWVDDFHHTARVRATGRAEAYTQDYHGNARELLSCALRNSLYQGQWYAWQKKGRGSVLRGTDPKRVIFFLQNHDQIANLLRGQRLHHVAAPSVARALTTFWLLLPQTPLLFMGQEFWASSPFFFFVDHVPELQKKVNEGRAEFVAQFASARCAMETEGYELPSVDEAYRRSQLDHAERDQPGHREALELHRALLELRRTDPCFSAQDRSQLDGAVLGEDALVLRYSGEKGDRLLLLNLGSDLRYEPCPEPLLAPLPGTRWRRLLSSEEIRFGGGGVCHPDGTGTWLLPGYTALVLASEEDEK